MDAFSERVPPQNLEAEQSVLGACLIDPDALPPVLRLLKPESFYADKHQQIYAVMQTLSARREPVDLISVQDHLQTKGQLAEIGGLDYLRTLINDVPSTVNTEQYAKIVAGKAELRSLQRAARWIVDECYRADDPDAMKTEAFHRMSEAVFDRASSKERQVGPALLEYVEEVVNAQAGGLEPANLIKSPFRIQNEVIPMARGEDTVVVAASGVGKTTYEKALQYGVAKLGGVVKGYSLEMSERQLLQKFWGLIARVNTMSIRKGRLSEDEIRRSFERVTGMLELAWYFEPRPRMKWADIKVDALAFKARHGKLDLMTVDYIQILGDQPPKNGRRDSQLGEIVEDGKALACELDCHIVFLAQQKINKHKPVGDNEDVAESRDIVRAADNVIFLTRPTEYDKDAEIELPVQERGENGGLYWTNKKFTCGQVDGAGNLLFQNVMLGFPGKQRMGSKSIIPYYFEAETGIVADLALPWPWNNPRGIPRKQEVPD